MAVVTGLIRQASSVPIGLPLVLNPEGPHPGSHHDHPGCEEFVQRHQGPAAREGSFRQLELLDSPRVMASIQVRQLVADDPDQRRLVVRRIQQAAKEDQMPAGKRPGVAAIGICETLRGFFDGALRGAQVE